MVKEMIEVIRENFKLGLPGINCSIIIRKVTLKGGLEMLKEY